MLNFDASSCFVSLFYTRRCFYLAIANVESLDHSLDVDIFKSSKAILPLWAAAVKKMLVVQPSSAALEHVFSILNTDVGDHQQNSLQDYTETLRYNMQLWQNTYTRVIHRIFLQRLHILTAMISITINFRACIIHFT